MIYSVHDPIGGGFTYYEFADGIKTNDDQPIPSFEKSKVTVLGVSSLDAAVPLPPDAKPAGRGKLPKGKISSGKRGLEVSTRSGGVSPDGTAGLGFFEQSSPINWAVLAGSALVGYLLYRRLT